MFPRFHFAPAAAGGGPARGGARPPAPGAGGPAGGDLGRGRGGGGGGGGVHAMGAEVVARLEGVAPAWL
eukprot:COSAG05_NODE_3271_length_2186_cov_459.916188_1_plen_68_part_10